MQSLNAKFTSGVRAVHVNTTLPIQVLKLKLHVNLLEHLQQIERDPDSTFVELLMKLQQNTKSHEHLCMLNYLSHWKL